MSKRIREHEEQDDITKLDPAVQGVIEGYEANLAQFMDSLSSLLERYNNLLQDALPYNPKAVFYYTAAPSSAAATTTATVAPAAADPTKNSDNAVAPPTAAAPADPPTPSAAEATARRAPTSPLLRRPQLPAQQLEELQLEAKAELARRTCSFSFPTAAELSASHHQHNANKGGTPDLRRSATPARGASAPTLSLDGASLSATELTTQHTVPPNHPLGIRTTLNKVIDKKLVREINKKDATSTPAAKEAGDATDNANTVETTVVAEAAPTSAAKEAGDATDNANTVETTVVAEAAPTSAVEITPTPTAAVASDTTVANDNVNNIIPPLSISNVLLTRTVAEVLQDVEMPPMLLVQLRILKKESQSLMFTFDQIHDWIAMKAPAMNETDNQGVAIMASVISVINSIMTSLQDLYDMERDYVTKRGQLEVQYVPNFECATIRDLINATDANKWDDIEVGWRTMMRAVLIVHARLASNMKTLRTPREKRVHHMSM